MRTQKESVSSLLAGIQKAAETHSFNILDDLKTLRKQYTQLSKRDYLALLDTLADKYETEEAGVIHAALVQKCRAGDVEAIKLYREMQQDGLAAGEEVQIIDDIKAK